MFNLFKEKKRTTNTLAARVRKLEAKAKRKKEKERLTSKYKKLKRYLSK